MVYVATAKNSTTRRLEERNRQRCTESRGTDSDHAECTESGSVGIIDTFLRSIARSTGVVARGRGSVRSFYHPIDRHARHGTEKTRNIDGAAGYISLIIPSSFSERPNIGTFWHLRQIAGMERLGIYFVEKEGTLPDLGTLGETQ